MTGKKIELPEGFTKEIIHDGDGDDTPDDGDEVSVHYTGQFEDGNEFDSSHVRGSPFNFTVGSGSVIKGWEIAIKTMKRNELAKFSIPAEYAYGARGYPPSIPPDTRLIFIIDLLDWVSGDEEKKPVYRMTIDERITKCQEKKEAGGALFKESKFDQAIKQYRDIMKLAVISEFSDDGKVVELENPELSTKGDPENTKKQELKQLLLVGHLNLALCYLKVNKLDECITNCDAALKIDPKNVKAHFRKGLAYLPTNDYEKALKQFDTVLEIDPNNIEAKAQKTVCNTAIRNYYQKQKDIFKNMFSSKS